MFGWCKEKEEDKKLLEDVVKYYKPSMRVITNGCGGWMLTMSPEEGRRTARIKGENGEDDQYVIDSIIGAEKHKISDAELAELINSGRK